MKCFYKKCKSYVDKCNRISKAFGVSRYEAGRGKQDTHFSKLHEKLISVSQSTALFMRDSIFSPQESRSLRIHASQPESVAAQVQTIW